MKGRGTNMHPHNRFLKNNLELEEQYLQEDDCANPQTIVYEENAKSILNKVDSPDLSMLWSMNPYQGCEHGCAYCYARNSHEYNGFNAGLDFESKIIVKRNAPKLLMKALSNKNWKPAPIGLSGNTDCYQPLEKKYKLTREILNVFLSYGNPVSVITKNSLILRDQDLLHELANKGLVHVNISITTLEESLRRRLEPRTASVAKRFETVERLRSLGIPVRVMIAPILPGLTDHELPALIKRSHQAGATSIGFTMVRLNGQLKKIFEDWLQEHYPNKHEKVMNQIASVHGGSVNDVHWGRRIRGDGPLAATLHQVYQQMKAKLFKQEMPPYNLNAFSRTASGNLFDSISSHRYHE